MERLKARKNEIKKEEKSLRKKLFFMDQPKEHISEDKFKHDIYVNTLEEILIKCETPINIGIFGKWGVGKTTIINFLKNRIDNNKSLKDEIKFLNPFDVWKYSGDSFRRQLLLHLNEALPKAEMIKDIEDKLYAIIEEEKEAKFKISKKGVIYSIIILLILALSAAYFNYKGIANAMLPLLLIPLFILLIEKLDTVLKTIMVKKILPRVESPEEFEKLFYNIIGKFNSKKVAIPIDNLDRCRQDVVVNTLGTIKTFLEKPRCVFIIPCDDEAIKNYINRMRGSDRTSEDGQEFLRKFFQVSFSIPIYLEETLENYMDEIFHEIELVDELDIKLKKRVKQVIISAFTKNPRRIKRFLNNLSILRNLASEIEKEKIINPGVITKNLDFLAKLTVIHEDWYEFYQYIENDNYALANIEAYFQGTKLSEDKEVKIKEFLNDNKYPGLKTFLTATRLIGDDITNIRPFLTLHQETYQASITELDSFQKELREGDKEYISEIFKKAKEKEAYENEILRALKSYRDQGYESFVFNILNVISKIFEKIIDKERISEEIVKILTASQFKNILLKLDDISAVINLLRYSPERHRNEILRYYLNYIENEEIKEDRERIFDSLIKNCDLLPQDIIKRLNIFIIVNYQNTPEETLQWIEKIVANKEAKDKIIDDSIIEDIINSIVETETETNNKKVELYFKLKDKAAPETKAIFVDKMIKIIQASTSNSYDTNKAYGLENILKLEIKDIPEQTSDGLHLCLNNQYNQMTSPENKLKFIEAMLKLIMVVKEEHKEDLIRNCVIHFINSQGPDNIIRLIEMMIVLNKFPLQEEIIDALSHRIIHGYPQQQPLIDSFIKLAEQANKKEKAKNLIVELINSAHYEIGLDSFNKHYEIFRQRDRDEIGHAVITKYKTLPPQQWESILNTIAIEKPEGTFSIAFINNLGENLLEHLKEDNTNIRNIGKNYYLTIKNNISDSKVKFIGQQLITKLKSLQPNINENVNPIFEVLIEEQERLERYTLEELIDILLSLTSESKPIEVRNMAFISFEKLKKLYRRSFQVLDHLLDLSKRANPGERELIIKALISFKNYKGRKNFREEAKEHFRELTNSENEKDRSIGKLALEELK